MNGLNFYIQDEMSLFSPNSVEEAYQCALKVEEKLNKRQLGRHGWTSDIMEDGIID